MMEKDSGSLPSLAPELGDAQKRVEIYLGYSPELVSRMLAFLTATEKRNFLAALKAEIQKQTANLTPDTRFYPQPSESQKAKIYQRLDKLRALHDQVERSFPA